MENYGGISATTSRICEQAQLSGQQEISYNNSNESANENEKSNIYCGDA